MEKADNLSFPMGYKSGVADRVFISKNAMACTP